MPPSIDRRAFVVGSVGAVAAVAHARQPEGKPPEAQSGWPEFPYHPRELVAEFVGASHGNQVRVRELLGRHPALAKSAYDWGFGDWESALGAASHVGHRDIALLLLEHGARLDLFAATMLGMVDAVRAMVAAQPGVQRTPGPHGISLLDHAKAGKHEGMIAYVASLDGAAGPTHVPLSDDELKTYLGRYATPSGEIEIKSTRFGMSIRAPKGIDRALRRIDGHRFHPVGAPNVHVSFTVADGKATRLQVAESQWLVLADRA